MRLVILGLLAGASACGSRGRAKPAEVEISWPDAAASAPVPLAAVSDAGLAREPHPRITDAGPTAEMPQ